MSNSITRTYTFANGGVADGGQVDSEIQNIVNTINNADAGTTSWTTIKSAGNITITKSGGGILITTPDGAHTVLISVQNLDANSNSSVTTQVIT